jgi:hypothetical protein
MRQFDVFAHPDPVVAKAFPFLLTLQSDFVPHTRAVVAAPLVRKPPDNTRLYPQVTLQGERFALALSDLAAVPRAALRRPVANLESERDRIVTALDILFFGI